MTGLISFILLVLGAVFLIFGGILAEGGKRGGAVVGFACGSILLLCSWVLA